MTYNEMRKAYRELNGADAIMLCVRVRDDVWARFYTFEEAERFYSDDTTSADKGRQQQIRFRPNTKQKAMIKAGAFILCKWADIEAQGLHNNGDAVEKYCVETYEHRAWVKNSTPWWVAGDCHILGRDVQIKFEGGEVTTEQAAQRAIREKGGQR